MKRINNKKELKKYLHPPVIKLKPMSGPEARRVADQLRAMQNKSNVTVFSEPAKVTYVPFTSAKRARYIKFHLKATACYAQK